jgi:hypothetical protein
MVTYYHMFIYYSSKIDSIFAIVIIPWSGET